MKASEIKKDSLTIFFFECVNGKEGPLTFFGSNIPEKVKKRWV